jgi:hypothetical protein
MSLSALSTYGEFELSQTIHCDPWAVRDETASRANMIARQAATLRRKLVKLEAEMANLERLHDAALAQIRVEQEASDPMDDFNYVGSRHHY